MNLEKAMKAGRLPFSTDAHDDHDKDVTWAEKCKETGDHL